MKVVSVSGSGVARLSKVTLSVATGAPKAAVSGHNKGRTCMLAKMIPQTFGLGKADSCVAICGPIRPPLGGFAAEVTEIKNRKSISTGARYRVNMMLQTGRPRRARNP